MKRFTLKLFGFRVLEWGSEEGEWEDDEPNESVTDWERIKKAAEYRIRECPRVVCDNCEIEISLLAKKDDISMTEYVEALAWVVVVDDLSLTSHQAFCPNCAKDRTE